MTSLALQGPMHPGRFVHQPNPFRIRAILEPEETMVEAEVELPVPIADLRPDTQIWLKPSSRRSGPAWTVAIIKSASGRLVSLDPSSALQLTEAAVTEAAIPELEGYQVCARNVLFGASRFDFALENFVGQKAYLQVMCVTLIKNGIGLFPASPSPRETKQLRSFTHLLKQNHIQGLLLLMVPRIDVQLVMPAADIDHEFVAALRIAENSGLRLLARRCQVTLEEIVLGVAIDVHIPPPQV